MKRSTLAALALACTIAYPAKAVEIAPFKAAPYCTELLGENPEAGLRGRILDLHRRTDWLRGANRSYSFIEILSMLHPTAAEYEEVIANADIDERLRNYLLLRLASLKGEYDFGYTEGMLTSVGHGALRMLARGEALADARAGRAQNVLKRFDANREIVLKTHPPDSWGVKSVFGNEPNLRAFVTLDAMRQLVLDGFEKEATGLAETSGDKRLSAFAKAMINGRAGLQAPEHSVADEIEWKSETGSDAGSSPLSEWIFQVVAARHWRHRDLLTSLSLGGFGDPRAGALQDASNFHQWLIARADIEALTLLYTVFDPNRRNTEASTEIVEELAWRGDVKGLRAIESEISQERGGVPPDPKPGNFYAALALGLIRDGQYDEALKVIGETSLAALAQNYIFTSDGPIPSGLNNDAGEAIPAALALLADDKSLGAWRPKLSAKQNVYVDLLRAFDADGWAGAEELMTEHQDIDFFGDNQLRRLNEYNNNLAFQTGHVRRIESLYDFALKEPPRDAALLLDWIDLARQHCVGWSYAPSLAFQNADITYRYGGSSLSAIGSEILQDAP